MSFRIWTIFYVMAVVAAALTLFGGWGIVVAAVVIGFWAYVYWPTFFPRPVRRFSGCLVVLIVLGLLAAFLQLSLVNARPAARRAMCLNNMRQLATALSVYQATFGKFPPAYLADANGKPMTSWRVLVLPFIDDRVQFNKYDFDKPWDDPANQPISSMILAYFRCFSDPSFGPTTNYVAVVGPHTAWPGERGRLESEFTDDPAETILLIETHGRNVRWAEPRDLTFDEAVDLLSQPFEPGSGHPVDPGFFYKKSSLFNVAFADGHVQAIYWPLDRQLAEALLTADGGERVDLNALATASTPQLDYAKCWVFAVLVVLVVLPVARLGRRRTAPVTEEHQP